jgi:hypothetical protein
MRIDQQTRTGLKLPLTLGIVKGGRFSGTQARRHTNAPFRQHRVLLLAPSRLFQKVTPARSRPRLDLRLPLKLTMYKQRQLAYAPTPFSYTPTASLSTTINLDEVQSAPFLALELQLIVYRKSSCLAQMPNETFTNHSQKFTASSSLSTLWRRRISRIPFRKASIRRPAAAC